MTITRSVWRSLPSKNMCSPASAKRTFRKRTGAIVLSHTPSHNVLAPLAATIYAIHQRLRHAAAVPSAIHAKAPDLDRAGLVTHSGM